ncbi:hypothetical protein C8F01DRAFT_984498, partial [Mycena amicta]
MLEMDPECRTPWAVIANHRLSKHIVKAQKVDADSLSNMFLQTWHASQKEWPSRHRGMLKAARKYGVEMDVVQPSRELQCKLPLWHHFAKKDGVRQLNNLPTSRCLRKVHKVTTVGDGMRVLERMTDEEHEPDAECWCQKCTDNRNAGCDNPHACTTAVERRLSQIQAKWDPRTLPKLPEISDDEDPLPDDEEKKLLFKPPPSAPSLSEGFRVLTKVQERPETHRRKGTRQRGTARESNATEVVASICGVMKTPYRKATRAGAGIYYDGGDERNQGVRIPEKWSQNKQVAEAIATILVIREVPTNADLTIVSD